MTQHGTQRHHILLQYLFLVCYFFVVVHFYWLCFDGAFLLDEHLVVGILRILLKLVLALQAREGVAGTLVT